MTPGVAYWLLVLLGVGGLGIIAWRGRRLSARLKRIAHASHELRGALGAIGLALARMDRPGLELRGGREGLEPLRAQHDRARLAVDDLDAALAGPSWRPAPASAVDLAAVVRRSVGAWAALHGRWRVVLDWRAGQPVVQGHATRLAQALDNLIANALEHGGGPVTVVGRAAGDSVSVAVLDRGGPVRALPGHTRPASWRARRGHGLLIARRAVELHGGEMRPVREIRGAGIEIRLPLSPGTSAATARAKGPSRPRMPFRTTRSA